MKDEGRRKRRELGGMTSLRGVGSTSRRLCRPILAGRSPAPHPADKAALVPWAECSKLLARFVCELLR